MKSLIFISLFLFLLWRNSPNISTYRYKKIKLRRGLFFDLIVLRYDNIVYCNSHFLDDSNSLKVSFGILKEQVEVSIRSLIYTMQSMRT